MTTIIIEATGTTPMGLVSALMDIISEVLKGNLSGQGTADDQSYSYQFNKQIN